MVTLLKSWHTLLWQPFLCSQVQREEAEIRAMQHQSLLLVTIWGQITYRFFIWPVENYSLFCCVVAWFLYFFSYGAPLQSVSSNELLEKMRCCFLFSPIYNFFLLLYMCYLCFPCHFFLSKEAQLDGFEPSLKTVSTMALGASLYIG